MSENLAKENSSHVLEVFTDIPCKRIEDPDESIFCHVNSVQNFYKRLCVSEGCKIREECLKRGLTGPTEVFGTWGGAGYREVRRMIKAMHYLRTLRE